MDWGDGREFDLIGAAIVKAGFVGDTGGLRRSLKNRGDTMWLLFSLLIVFATVSLLLVKIRAVARESGPVWQSVAPENPAEPEQGTAPRVITIDNPEPQQIMTEILAEPQLAAELVVAIDTPEPQPVMTEIVLPLDEPASAAKSKARRGRALAAKHS